MSAARHTDTSDPSCLNGLFASFEQLCTTDPSGLDGRGLRAALESCRRYRARIDAIEAGLIAAGSAAGAFEVAGSVDAAGYLREQVGLSGREARRRAETAEALCELPATAAALEAGEIGFEHAAVVAKAADEKHREAIKAAEKELVADAKQLSADRFKRAVRSFCDEVDRDGGLSRQERLRARRSVSQRMRGDGMGVTVLELPPDGHAYYRSALGAIAEELWRADHPNTNDPVPVEARSNRQRLADAAVEMARRALGASAGAAREARPVVIAKLDYDTLTERLRVDHAELAGVGSIPAEAARRTACDCELLPAMFGANGEVLDAGRSLRLPTRAMRRALVARDAGCRFPGCDRPHEWCEAHHIRFWDHGGPTSVDNLLLLCSKHHHLAHEGGWQITGPAHSVTVHRPDGTLMARNVGPPGSEVGASDHRLRREPAASPEEPDAPDVCSATNAPDARVARSRAPSHRRAPDSSSVERSSSTARAGPHGRDPDRSSGTPNRPHDRDPALVA